MKSVDVFARRAIIGSPGLSAQLSCISEKDLSDSRDENSCASPQKEMTKDRCYICLENKPNAVLMPCGHGGICNKCGISLLEDESPCPICRDPVEILCDITSVNAKLSKVTAIWEPNDSES